MSYNIIPLTLLLIHNTLWPVRPDILETQCLEFYSIGWPYVFYPPNLSFLSL